MKCGPLVLSILVSACASTTITSFVDPDFKGRKYSSFVVVTPNLNLEYASLLQGAVCKSLVGHGATCARSLDMFPPTRNYTGQQIAEALQAKRVTAYLVVTYGGGGTSSTQVGTMAYGSATVSSNTVTAYGSAVPITSFKPTDGYEVVLIDTATFNKAWIGGAKTQASGLANITDSVFTSSLAKEVAAQLSSAGLL